MEILKKISIPDKVRRIIAHLYWNQKVVLRYESEITEEIEIKKGVRSIPSTIQCILGNNFQRGPSGNWREPYLKYSLRRQHSAGFRQPEWTIKYICGGGRCESRIQFGNQ